MENKITSEAVEAGKDRVDLLEAIKDWTEEDLKSRTSLIVMAENGSGDTRFSSGMDGKTAYIINAVVTAMMKDPAFFDVIQVSAKVAAQVKDDISKKELNHD